MKLKFLITTGILETFCPNSFIQQKWSHVWNIFVDVWYCCLVFEVFNYCNDHAKQNNKSYWFQNPSYLFNCWKIFYISISLFTVRMIFYPLSWLHLHLLLLTEVLRLMINTFSYLYVNHPLARFKIIYWDIFYFEKKNTHLKLITYDFKPY